MTTTIDNTQRKFWIAGQGFGGQADVICNLEDIPKVISGVIGTKGGYKIYELFNRKWKACSKKHLNEMFESHQVNFKIS